MRNGTCLIFLISLILGSCKGKNAAVSKESIDSIHLKRGALVSCGLPGNQFGTVEFESSCKDKKQFDLAVEMLHSFEYDEAEKVFSKIIDEEPGCAMAYWGVAMCNYHPLWTAPSEPELKKGAKAIGIAQRLPEKAKREADYIDAIAAIYKDWDKVDLRTRTLNFEKGMEKIVTAYPGDKEAAIFYALALDAAADPSDKSFANQKKAGAILNALYPNEPDHPGIAHYIIHTYDYPGLAVLALPAARKYASVAPSSAHALHMPSHIFTRLGLWDECIRSNLASIAAAQCYAETAGIKGHWDEELHGLDYLVYAYLQKGENALARKEWDYLRSIREVYPMNFKVAYAFAAIPARYVLENKLWKEAATLQLYPMGLPWEKFPWQKAIYHFARLLGSVHTGSMDSARLEYKELNRLHDTLVGQKDPYKTNQVLIQLKASEAWVAFKEGRSADALKTMNMAADLEDATEKHPVTPGEIIPAKELLGDLLLAMNKPDKALEAYEADLVKHPNRWNALYGAGLAAERSGNPEKAGGYYRQLLKMISPNSTRPELTAVRLFFKSNPVKNGFFGGAL